MVTGVKLKRFGQQAKKPAHIDLMNTLCRRYLRKVNDNRTMCVDVQIIQLLPTASHHHLVKSKVIVNRWLDGSWHIFHRATGEVPCKPFELSINKLCTLA